MAVWLLPPGTTTRAVRFTHVGRLTDRSYTGWLLGAWALRDRYMNRAPEAIAVSSTNDVFASLLNNSSTDEAKVWDNLRGPDQPPVSRRDPEWVMLVWPEPVPLRGLAAVRAGFAAAEVQIFHGPEGIHPRAAPESDWETLPAFPIKTNYVVPLGPNWLDFGGTVTTRAVRLKITSPTQEDHPHLVGATNNGRRVWLGELLALQPLGSRPPPVPATVTELHPPIPIRFNLPVAGYVTLVIEDQQGRRVRNLVAETFFPAGADTAWWDGLDDLGREPEAADHGVDYIPGHLVEAGTYRVRGLFRQAVELRYQMTVYNPGDPPWTSANPASNWLANHTPPQSALFVPEAETVLTPAGRTAGGLILVGSYVTEDGSSLGFLDTAGHKKYGLSAIGGSWTGAPFLAGDAGPKRAAGVYAYAGSAWENHLRLTALSRDKQTPVLTPNLSLPPPREVADSDVQLAGLAARNGILVASLGLADELLFVDAAAGKVLDTVPLKSRAVSPMIVREGSTRSPDRDCCVFLSLKKAPSQALRASWRKALMNPTVSLSGRAAISM